ncbi:MAG: MerR family transcriptional regulator [Sphingomonadales bacterium]|jgi:DNA-binding transcriptional MerR regulator
MKEQHTYSIRDLAKEFNITPRTIRFYEDRGLIKPARVGQKRVYSKADKARLDWILRGKRVGFSISEIDKMLSLYDIGDGRLKQRDVTLKNCREKIDALIQQRNDIDATIFELSEFCDTIGDLVLPKSKSPNIKEKEE